MNQQSGTISTDTDQYPVRVEEMTPLIRRLGWSKIPHPNPNLLVYEKGTDDRGNPIKLVLPSGNDFADAPSMIRTAVRLVADLQDWPVGDLLERMRNSKADVLRQRLLANARISSLSLETAPRIIGYLRDLIYYCACAEDDPRPFFEKGLKIGREFTDKCRFGHTFTGSFGLSIQMPIPPNPGDAAIPPGANTPAPIERRVMQRLLRGLVTASRGVREGDVTLLTKGYATGFNANSCEVMAEMTATLSDIRSEYSILWSPEYAPAADLQYLAPVGVDPSSFRPYFEAAAKSLRQVQESQDTQVTGVIIQLRAQEVLDTGGDDERHILIRWELDHGRHIKIRASLDAESYKIACDAHRDHRTVAVTGRPEKQGKFWVLTAAKNFTVLPDQQ